MYEYNQNSLIIGSNHIDFSFDIRDVIKYEDYYIVLLDIPTDKKDLNNIYCLDKKGKMVWQVEDINKIYPRRNNLPYEQMGIKDGVIYASDFYGRNYSIDFKTGKIGGYRIMK